MQPQLSIIIPTYQAGATLEIALQSIVRQTFKSYEVLIMDGGSNDNTSAIAQKFSTSNSNVFFFSAPDRGIYDAMNKGIDISKGDWLYFLGSDDALHDHHVLENIFNSPDNLKWDVLYGQVLLKDTNQLYLGEFNADKLVFKNISHQAIFIKRAVFAITGKFDLKYKICADHILNVKWFFNSNVKKKYIPDVIATFGQQGISTQKDDEEKVRDLPLLVREYAGIIVYFKLYFICLRIKILKKKLSHVKKKFLTFFKRK